MAANPPNPTTLPVAAQQAMFFRDPLEEPQTPGFFSTLYLLRRDLNDHRNFMRDPEHNCEPIERALWLKALGICAGFDLLAKFLQNDDTTGGPTGVTFRYTRYLRLFVTHEPEGNNPLATALYQLRNSLLHSFGWYSRAGATTYRFRLATDKQNWLVVNQPLGSETWFVNLTRLEQCFEESIQEYSDGLNDPAQTVLTFPTGRDIFENYGWTYIGP